MNKYYLYINSSYFCVVHNSIIPRIGETIEVQEKQYTVINVKHNILVHKDEDKNKCWAIEVYVK